MGKTLKVKAKTYTGYTLYELVMVDTNEISNNLMFQRALVQYRSSKTQMWLNMLLILLENPLTISFLYVNHLTQTA